LLASGCNQRRTKAAHVYQLKSDVKTGHVLVQADLSDLVFPALRPDVPPAVDGVLIGDDPVTMDDVAKYLGHAFAKDVAAGTVLQKDMVK
jgi:hypothetical protein